MSKRQLTAVFIRDRKALDLLSLRAAAENRTAANAAAVTIIESLSRRYGKKHTVLGLDSQGNSAAIVPDSEGKKQMDNIS
ncbi:MAG TPA: hypothetical protein PKB02_11565 [Anaerohalosphaeraceae bacterium]|jgi:hypothetical protein|nr:hypothetical protein [Anaerohalosphaeraceae bacterium]